MATEILWTSPSELKKYVDCPAASTLPYVQTPEMLAGNIRHWSIEQHYRTGTWGDPTAHRQYGELPPDIRKLLVEDMTEAQKHPSLFPPDDWVLSVEGDGLPKAYTIEAYGRKLFKVQLSPTFGIRGSSDLVAVDPSKPDRLIIPDWKGRSEEEHDIQAGCYVATHSVMFPGFQEYEFRAVPIGRWCPEPYLFPASEIPAIIAYLEDLAKRMKADRMHFPHRNRWCGTCAARNTCPLFEEAFKLIDEQAVVPKVDTFPSEPTGSLLKVKQEMLAIAKIADSIKKAANNELVGRLSKRPETIGSYEYYVADKVTRWYVTEEAAAFAVAKQLGIPPDSLLKFDVSTYSSLVEKAIGELEPAARVDLEAAYAASLRSSTFPDIRRRTK